MNLLDLSWPRRTERLVIRPLRDDDRDTVWAYRRLPDNAYWTGGLAADADDLFGPIGDDREPTRLVVEQGGVVIGDLMVRVGDGWGQRGVRDQALGVEAELGWTFAPEHHGQGFATEAVRDLLAICFDGLEVRRVTAVAFEQNQASWRLMERVGLRREGHMVRDSLHAELGWLDGVAYALLADEWRSRSHG